MLGNCLFMGLNYIHIYVSLDSFSQKFDKRVGQCYVMFVIFQAGILA